MALIMKKLTSEITTAIFEALDGASMQWEPRPAGEFDSAACKKIGEDLIQKIEAADFNAFVPWPDEEFSMDTFTEVEFRVYTFAAMGLMRAVNDILDRPDDRKGVTAQPWQSLRERLWALHDLVKQVKAGMN
jgi:hypothetical protein